MFHATHESRSTVKCDITSIGKHSSVPCTFRLSFDLVSNGVDFMETRSGSRVGFRRITKLTETLGEFRYLKSTPFDLASWVNQIYGRHYLNIHLTLQVRIHANKGSDMNDVITMHQLTHPFLHCYLQSHRTLQKSSC